MFNLCVSLFCCFVFIISTRSASATKCNVRVRIDSGWVCGLIRESEYGKKYASFRKIPYGQQPLGNLRFKELQPVQPWSGDLDATEEGPRCPQDDWSYGRLTTVDKGMSESCIHANVHVPIEALQQVNGTEEHTCMRTKSGYPIFVFIHGGSFCYGSGTTDLHGPEYLVSKGVIVITFNYRINVFGFLSLNTAKIPGNAGLRDQLTLLRWVQRNARAFGGDPNDVTLGGHSSGSACSHLLAMSRESKGLFKRLLLMSASAITPLYTGSLVYANSTATAFLKILGVNATDPDQIHDELVSMPIERIVNANSKYQLEAGIVPFSPVVETPFDGVTRIIDDDPVEMVRRGRDKDYPMIIGFTNNECEYFRYTFEYTQMLRRIDANPALILSARIALFTQPNVTIRLAKKVMERYFHGMLNYDDYLVSCKETIFEYPSFQLARWRAEIKTAPTYLYKFSYKSNYSVLKDALYKQYKGNAHVEDLTYIFRENAMLGNHSSFPPMDRDDSMKDWMTNFVVNFIRCNDPSCGYGWAAVDPHFLNYQVVFKPGMYTNTRPVGSQLDMIRFHDKLDRISRKSSAVVTALPPQPLVTPPLIK